MEKLSSELISNHFISDEFNLSPQDFESKFTKDLSQINHKIIWIDRPIKNKTVFYIHTIFTLVNALYPNLLNSTPNLFYEFIIKNFINGDKMEFKKQNLKSSFTTWNSKKRFGKNYSEREIQLINIIKSSLIKK